MAQNNGTTVFPLPLEEQEKLHMLNNLGENPPPPEKPKSGRKRRGTNLGRVVVLPLEIILHYRPHGDELVAAALTRIRPDLAERMLSGLSTARIRVFDKTAETLKELEAKAKQGTAILLGFGDDPTTPNVFTEHNGLERDTCTAKLFAGKLGLLEDPDKKIWIPILEDMFQVDSRGAASGKTHLPHYVRTWEGCRNDGMPLDQLIRRVVEDLERISRNETFVQQTTGKHEEFSIGNFTAWCLPPLDLQSRVDDKEARRAQEEGACLIIAPTTGGNINLLIGFNNKGAKGFPRGPIMRRIAALTRVAEAEMRGRQIPINSQIVTDMFRSGTWQNFAPEWYLDPRTWEFFNGAKSHPEKSVTRITPEGMKNIIRHACDDQWIINWIATNFGKEYVNNIPGIRH